VESERISLARLIGAFTPVPIFRQSAKYVLAGIFLSTLSACTTIDFDHPRTTSTQFTNTQDGYIAQQLVDEVQGRTADESGFLPLIDGIDALAARLLFAEKAQFSIDVQYYLIKDDLVGNAFMAVLLRAADRGVRVRLLIDDVFTQGYDNGMSALNAHPHIEIRVFNPFNRGIMGRAGAGLTRFSRINRRLHNKSFTVDNQISLIGGRNIADEYFGAAAGNNFSDLDVVGIGPVVQEVSDMFDLYWNHQTALPIPAFIDPPDDIDAELRRLRSSWADHLAGLQGTRYANVVNRQVSHFLTTDADFVWAPYTLVYDSPDKGLNENADERRSIATALSDSLHAAKFEVIILSPYFVPLRSGIAGFSRLRARGIEVAIVTNSLRANNHAIVHGGYMPARRPLLRAGVRLYEARADAQISGAGYNANADVSATLHTKAFIVDRKELFIGSFNFDPRSVNLNTELGVLIRDPALAEQLAKQVVAALPSRTYELKVDDRSRISWHTLEGDEEVVYAKEPHTTWTQRLVARIARVLPIHSQL